MNPDSGRPIGRRVLTAPQQIANAIRDSILEGALGPGDRLPTEEQMAEMFGVSRPTLREALRDLRTKQVLVAERGRNGGYRVAEFSLHTLSASVAEYISLSLGAQRLTHGQLFEVRRALEVLSAGAAAERRTDEDLERLWAALPDPDEANGPEELLAADVRFHRVLAECTHNPLIVGFAGATAAAFRPFAAEMDAVAPPMVLAHLDEVVEGVGTSDARAAQEAMKRHLAYYAEHFGLSSASPH